MPNVISFAVEQGFGCNLEVLEVFSECHRAIWTTNAKHTVDFVLDQVVKKVDNRTVFVGVVSRYHRKKPMRNLGEVVQGAKRRAEKFGSRNIDV